MPYDVAKSFGISDLGRKPADDPSRVRAGRLREMTAEFEEFWTPVSTARAE